MNYLSLLSDLALEIIAKYTSDIHIFPILNYCSINTAEQILFRNISTIAYQDGFYIELYSSKLLIYYGTVEYYIYSNAVSFKLFRYNKIIISIKVSVCNKCKNQIINLWKYVPYKYYFAININCNCKN